MTNALKAALKSTLENTLEAMELGNAELATAWANLFDSLYNTKVSRRFPSQVGAIAAEYATAVAEGNVEKQVAAYQSMCEEEEALANLIARKSSPSHCSSKAA